MKTKLWTELGLVAAVAILAGGCAAMGGNQRHRASNLSTYLYSSTNGVCEPPSVPVLAVPLHVGIAFVPVESPTNPWPVYLNGTINGSYQVDPPLSESQRLDLMRQISGQLAQYPALAAADLIASDYLVPRGGFANLDRLRAMYGVDTMVLISFDQAQFTDEGAMTLSYWTIVGYYVVPAEKNLTKTVLEAAVYDIASRKLLFRATGTGSVKGSATPVNLSEQLRLDSKQSFEMAATDLAVNLKSQVAEFEKQAAANPGKYIVQREPGNAAGGMFGEKE